MNCCQIQTLNKHSHRTFHRFVLTWSVVTVIFVLFIGFAKSSASEVLSPADLLKLKSVSSAEISPDGNWIAYTLRVPRTADDQPGGAYSELHLLSVKTGQSRPFITGKVVVSGLAWKPDGSAIAFRTRRGSNAKTQVWMIPVDGGEAQQLTHANNTVSSFKWHPSGKKLAYLATTPPSKREKKLAEKGYGFIFFEENLKHRNLYLLDLTDEQETRAASQLTENVTVWSFEFSPEGETIAAAITQKNLVDHRYMFQKIYLLDVASKKLTQLTDNPGKLGNFVFSPDGRYLAYAAALERKDHAVSQAFVIPVTGGEARNLTEPNFRGHVNWVGWKDKNTLIYRAGEGVWSTLSAVNVSGGKRKILLNSREEGVIFSAPSATSNFQHLSFIGQSPESPGEVYYWRSGKKLRRLTVSNPWLAERKLGKQEVVRYQSRDNWDVEGLLIYPVDYQTGQKYPLVVLVHGGPESHFYNGWLSNYSRPGQVLSGKGYAVFYPNYRSSTGYGLEYAAIGYNEAAGREFDDIADGIDFLVEKGIADRERVGLGGGSYGGFASAWFASYYTKYVKAVCMFVGISDLISKRGTSDIPYEELYVHSGKKLEEMWEQSLKRSPIYWAHQSKTATLIYGGTADTRVHPSQSLEFYRRLKMNDHPAVRLVRYPGEPHGNRKQTGQIDVLYRIIDWYDWYVKEAKPLNGPMPPLDISHKYGLDLPE
ncbi:MAG: prolyl oligopeptidase family serine peptidase [bacterium]